MFIYFWIVRLVALLGHRKARRMVAGQGVSLRGMLDWRSQYATSDVVWIHVSSVGEFEQVRPIIERLRAEQPHRKLVLTFFSPSGYELRQGYDKVDKVLYLPFATRRNAKRWVAGLRPSMAIFVKYEFWPAYLRSLKQQGVATYLISAIFRPRQLFFMPWGGWYRRLLHCFNRIFVQDTASLLLLNKYGISHATVAGDTRFDRVMEVKNRAKDLPVVASFVANRSRVLVAGSTWPEEEELLARYMKEHDDVGLILVPHELHSHHMQQIFQCMEGRYVRYSEATPMSVSMCSTLLVDEMGLLSSIYRYGHVAYIGGGFGSGIHNTLEAAVYGMPVVFGPRWKKFREAHGLLNVGAAFSVGNYREMAAALDAAFAQQSAMGQRARDYVKQECGATRMIYNELFNTK